MPTSEQNLRSLHCDLTRLSETVLVAEAHRYAALPAQERAQWELPKVDIWADRELPSPSKISRELPSLSLPGLKRLEERLQQLLQPVLDEQQQRQRKRGPPHKPDLWIASAFYYELKGRGRVAEANKFLKKLDVSEKTLRRYRENPHRDE